MNDTSEPDMGGAPTDSFRRQVELFGVPRLLAGQRSFVVTSVTLKDLAAELARACPSLSGPVIDPDPGWLREGYTFVVDERFKHDPSHPVAPDSSVLLASSVAGGRGLRMFGAQGKLLRVNLTSSTAAIEAIPELGHRRLLGGVGLARFLLDRNCPAGVDPFSPENPLIFASSPFTGTGITTASKIAIAAKSPLTGMIGDSLSSSYLAIALKRTGIDALVDTGRVKTPTVLIIDDDRIRFESATPWMGHTPAATAAALRASLGSRFRVAAIGIAGEHGVRYAAISNDGRLAGRTGVGAVMGSKRLKTVAVRGSRLPAVADPTGIARAARMLAERSLGPETAKYREIGAAAKVAFFYRMGLLPTRNFQPSRFNHAEAISGETLRLDYRTDKRGCAACTVGCEHHYRTRDGGAPAQARLEYESLFAPRGACHNRSSAYEVESISRISSKHPPTRCSGLERRAASEDQTAVLDSLTLCKFLRHCFRDLYGEAAALYSLVTGYTMDGNELRQASERINNLKKLFNIREGWTSADDCLPERVLDDGDQGGLTHAELDDLVARDYDVRGWNGRGLISTDHLARLGLDELLDLESSAGEKCSEFKRARHEECLE